MVLEAPPNRRKLNRVHFHDLRHRGASIMLARDFEIGSTQTILGHSSSMTRDTYVHLTPDSHRTAAVTFDRLLGLAVDGQ